MFTTRMIKLSINRMPYRAEQELSRVYIGIAKYLHSLFHPVGFFILNECDSQATQPVVNKYRRCTLSEVF